MKQVYKTYQNKPVWAYGESLAVKPMPDAYYSGITTARPFTTQKRPEDMLSKFPYKGKQFVPRGVVN